MYDFIGLIGVISYLSAYIGHQLLGLRTSDPRYFVLKLLGPVCILISLSNHFNLASFVNQCMWFLITLGGWWRASRRRALPAPESGS